MDQINEPTWWKEVSTASDEKNQWIFVLMQIQAAITPADVVYLEQIMERGSGQELRRAAGVLNRMLRGRFPAIMPRREIIARDMLALAKDGYPESERARYAVTVLTQADREAASKLVQEIDFARSFPAEHQRIIGQQLASVNTDASLIKLDEFLASQDDPKLGIWCFRQSTRYVPVEELGRRWQKNHDTATLNLLMSEWIQHVYEGYPLENVVAIMGQPQRSGRHYVHYMSNEGHVIHLETNDSGQVFGRSGPR